ncbi:PD-(D/E)XK nuclease domain-containing protein [Anaerolineales bacterium HSG25]|nr:PD-(D/E)XK nuclease domain-containing protein [Anaerolineales bacterium HSG25]
MTRGGRELRDELGTLLEGQSIIKPLYENIIMRDILRRDNLLWSFLLFSGYLKMVAQINDEAYRLELPNREIELIYRDLVKIWFEEKVRVPKLEGLLTSLQRGDVRVFERMLRQIVTEIMSYHDLAGEPEKVYQALVLGMLVWLSDKYEIRTNRESGYGRYDMMFKPKSLSLSEGQPSPLAPFPKGEGNRGIIIEFKRVYDNETPEEVMAEALKQINDKAYTTELEAAGVTDILRLAIVFQGKKMWLRQG